MNAATQGRAVVRARRAWRMIPVVALVATAGCFATRNDVRIVQGDVAALRTEMLKNDAAQRDALLQATRILSAVTDSMARISARTTGIQGDVRGEFRNVKEQLLQVQTLLGQSQAATNRLRAEMESRNNAPVSPLPVTSGTPPVAGAVTSAVAAASDSTASVPAGPTAAQLYQTGMDQSRRGSTSTARTYFQELLSKYPDSDLAPDAQNAIAQTLEREKNVNGADAAYAAVLTKYPDSRVAPTALYKRAQIALQKGNTADARKMLQEVVSRYPKSTEADVAADQLKNMRP